LSKILTDTPGSSEWFEGSIISYSNALKTRIGVNEETLLNHGAVSENTAIEMAKNTKDLINSSVCVSITGIAGPEGGSDEKPVGLVYFCFYKSELNYKIFCKNFNGDRLSIREQAADEAIKIVVDNF
jgi:PncC family amidohydrolase